MGGPSSDFHALLVRRIAASTNGQALKLPGMSSIDELRTAYKNPEISQTNLIPVAAHILLPKDLLPALRQAKSPKMAACLAVQTYIERSQNGLHRPALNMNSFQTLSSFNVTASIAPFGIRKF